MVINCLSDASAFSISPPRLVDWRRKNIILFHVASIYN